jgi:hypothetical protein
MGPLLAAAAALVAMASQAAELRVAFEDNKLNFKSCDGKNLTARWRDNNFHVSVPGRTIEPSAPQLEYLGWDGVCRRLSVDNKGKFVHARDGASEANHIINYVSWDDSKWSATRAGTGFYQVFVAGKDESMSPARMKDAALWLEQHKADSHAASLLASELIGASKE